MSGLDIVKFVASSAVGTGVGVIVSNVAKGAVENSKSRITKMCVGVATMAISGAVTTACVKPINDMLDAMSAAFKGAMDAVKESGNG